MDTRTEDSETLLPTKCRRITWWFLSFSFLFHLGPTLGYRKHLTPSQLSTELVPPRVTENDNIFLLAYNLPEKLQSFFWHKGVHPLDRFKIASHSFLTNSSMVGSAYHDRVIICNDASLMLLNVTQRDTGLYTLRTVSMDLKSEWAIVDVQVNSKWFFVIPRWWWGLFFSV